MSLFSGARMGELCQLTVDDLKLTNDCWVFRITSESSEEQRLRPREASALFLFIGSSLNLD